MRRMCLECFEDYTTYEDEFSCPACQIEHELRGRPMLPGKYPEPATWGYEGPTLGDIDLEAGDLDGFHGTSIYDGDFPLELDSLAL